MTELRSAATVLRAEKWDNRDAPGDAGNVIRGLTRTSDMTGKQAPMNDTQHALYRFFDNTAQLLYVGITIDPGARWKSHSKAQPWWLEVTNVTVEPYPSRSAVIDAERAAIIAERPRYNIVHNHGRSNGTSIPTAQLDRLLPIQVGDWAALGLKDGRCPVGGVMALDDTWVSLRLKDFLMGYLDNQIEAIRWDEIERILLAYPEDAEKDHFGSRAMDDEHLGEFQSAWYRAHFGKDGRDPIDQARREYRAERQEERDQRDRLRNTRRDP